MHLDVDNLLNLTLEDIQKERAVVLGASGAGKTNTVAVLVEEVGEYMPFVIVDPHGEYWGLREKFDVLVVGKSENVDLELTSEQAATIAEYAYCNNLSIILDLLFFTDEERASFVITFFNALWQVCIRQKKPYAVILDEAHNFIPEGYSPPVKKVMKRVALEGRKFGLTVILATQTTTEISKTVLKMMGIRILHAVYDYQDIKSYQDRIPLKPAEAESLILKLATGQAIVVRQRSVQIVQIRRRETFHVGETPAVDSMAPQLRAIDAELLQELRDRFAQASDPPPEAAPVTAANPRIGDLQRQIADLKRQLAEKPQTLRVEVPVLTDDMANLFGTLAQQMIEDANELQSLGQQILSELRRVKEPALRATQPAARKEAPAAPAPEQEEGAALSLRRGERKILEVLARRHPTKMTRAQLGTLSGFTPSGGTFGTYYGKLKRLGLLAESNGETLITQVGFDALGYDLPAAPQTTEEVFDMWKAALRSGEWKMLEALIDIHPRAFSREELGNITGFTASGGTFGTYLGTLRRNGLVVTERQLVRASDTLFLSN